MWEHLKKSRSTQAHISVVKAPLHHRAGMSYSFSAQSRNRKHRALQLSCSHRPFCFYIWIMKQNLPCSYSITLLWKGVLKRTENLYCKRIVNYYWYQVNFTPKNFFFYCWMKQWGKCTANKDNTGLHLGTGVSPSCSKRVMLLCCSVPLCQGHQVGVHFSLCQNPGWRQA